jgi:hypothetical protein
MTRKTDPFTIIPIAHYDIDFKQVAATTMRNTKVDLKGNRIQWLNIRWLRYTKSDPKTLYYKYKFDEDFKTMKVQGTSSRRGRQDQGEVHLINMYNEKLPVSAVKKRDLLELCRVGVIPVKYHQYYHDLPSHASAPDRLLVPDAVEEDNEDDDE